MIKSSYHQAKRNTLLSKSAANDIKINGGNIKVKEPTTIKEMQVLKKGLIELMSHIQKIKKEIALIKNPDDHFAEISDELDAVIESTEQATSDIMENSENIDDIVNEIKAKIKDENIIKSLDKISENTSNIIVSCSFQDITGQRVTKVIRAMQYVEERINSLIATWGREDIEKIKIEKAEETDEEKKLLNGPALKGQGISQAEVDAMLNGQKIAHKDEKNQETNKVAKETPKNNDSPKQAAAINQNDIDALFD